MVATGRVLPGACGLLFERAWLVAALPGLPNTRAFRLAFAALFTAAHAAIARVASVQLTGVDYPWYLQCGVANQYILGPGLQPSVFGTFLFAALAAFANGRTLLAGVFAGAACAFHTTYILPAAMLLIGFVAAMVRSGQHGGPAAFKMMLATVAFATPAAAYAVFTFGPSNPITFAESQRILAEVRIPHHTMIDRWFAWPDAVQLVWIAVGLLLLRRSPLCLVLSIAAASASLSRSCSTAARATPSALLFPWRISAVLVPAATAVIAASLAARLPSSNAVAIGAGAVMVALAAGGIWIMAAGVGYRMNEGETALLDFVRKEARPNDVYLLPVSFPEVGHGRGTASTTFTPPPRPKPGSNLIPVDLQRFRLATGTPIFVDFKSVPYLDNEVLEWQRRMKQCEAWYEGDWSAFGSVQELRAAGITHVVAPAAKPIKADGLIEVHADPAYIVYEVR